MGGPTPSAMISQLASDPNKAVAIFDAGFFGENRHIPKIENGVAVESNITTILFSPVTGNFVVGEMMNSQIKEEALQKALDMNLNMGIITSTTL